MVDVEFLAVRDDDRCQCAFVAEPAKDAEPHVVRRHGVGRLADPFDDAAALGFFDARRFAHRFSALEAPAFRPGRKAPFPT